VHSVLLTGSLVHLDPTSCFVVSFELLVIIIIYSFDCLIYFLLHKLLMAMILSLMVLQSQTSNLFCQIFPPTSHFLLHLILFHFHPYHLMVIIFRISLKVYLYDFFFFFQKFLSFILSFLWYEYFYRYLPKDFFQFNNLLTYRHHVKLLELISLNMDHTYKACLRFFYSRVPLVLLTH